ncbi:CCR4-NOT transcription complex subunit 1 isoform X2 [Cynara cardunculus var. scolymus]|uniref:CCR4-NOT transcription complex subunit 1 isoform X2 n=1 Tax=Cynara cardunculus var. scolymus TaxID=59895 RepID=UPI000D627549|nr:CCR4-NOT transcription complex subunit 1 isoform X2 [Cynara cardunculus var. scolymus]
MIPLAQRFSTEIRLLFESLNDSNFDSVLRELSQYVDYGTEGSVLLLETCLDHFNVYEKDLKSTRLEPVVASLFRKMLEKPQFSTVFSVSVRPTAITEEFLDNLSIALQLSAYEKLGFGLALTDSENNDIRMAGRNFCMGKIEELFATHTSLHTADCVQDILLFLNKSEVLSKHVDSFMQLLSLVQFDKDSGFILAPLLSDELQDSKLLSDIDFLSEGNDDEFDAILAEMEKEMSMADMLRELGYKCTLDVSLCKDLLSSFSPLTEITVARILGTIVRFDAGLQDHENAFSTFCSALGRGSLSDMSSLNSWNTDVLIESIKQLAPGISWTTVIENLDHEGFYIPDEAAFLLLISCYRHASQDPFPLAAVCGNIWKNTEGQLSFLKCAVSVPPEVFTFAHCERQVAYVDIANNHKFQSGHANHAWLCLDLLEVLCQLAERGLANSVRLLLEHPLRNCPEVLLFGMAHVNTPYNLIQHEVSSVVLPMILKDASLDNTNRVLDIFQELKIVSPVLDMVPMYLGIRLAALASRKELVDLEKWLSMNLSTYRDTFFEECLRFLKEVEFGAHESSNRLHNSSNIWSLYMETAPVFLKVLQSHTSLLSSNQLSKEMERLHLKSTNNSSRMKNNGGPDSSTSEVYADDIETEANSYFQQMFSGVLTIDAMVQMLARFKESSEKREQSIFECMIANLFEEYKFFNRYPDRQLKLAAVLFGLLIKNQLVTHLTLGIALRAVLDALRKPADSKMFVFGTKALEKFVDRLIEWPQYCQHILQISHLRGTHSELVAFIERALARISSGHPESDAGHNPAADQHHNSIPQANIEMAASSFPLIGSGGGQLGSQIPSPIQLQQRNQSYLDERHRASVTSSNYMKPNLTNAGQVSVAPASEPVSIPKPQSVVSSSAALASSPAFVRPSRGSSARFGSALNIETLVAAAERRETPIEAPPSETQDKISFIINNLSAANIEAKAKEFTEILKEQYYPWFAQYMVMKRASIEPNFHDLYLKFLEKANSKPLNREIVQATYENCKVLLGSELIKSSSEERSLLKNLGGWLGKITIGRNHVLRAKEIDPKALIIEAYEKGLMIAVIPFTSKILEACQSSLAYQPPNPWTMGILGLLAEIYAMPNLKMNLKFEIEVLFKNLNVDLKEVTPTSLLMDRVREIEGNPDFSNKDVGSAQQPMVGEVKSSMISTLNQVELPLEVASSSHPGSHSRILSQYAAPLHLPAATLSEDEKMAALGLSDQLPSAQGLLQAQLPFSVGQLPASNIDQQVIVNPKLQALGLHLHFQSVLPMSMDRAIKEIVSSIVQRSVSIATQTTKELVLKDYAMESDESRIHSAAHLMVASLAGSLAHVTCKEPLRGSISSQLRNNLQTFNIASELFEHAIQLATNDNLDLGCALIEQAATEKAVQTIDGELAPQLSIRRKHREGVGPAFFDASLYTQGHVGVLPEALRPKPGRLSHSQQRVYEDFVRLPWQNQSNQNSNAVPLGPSAPQGSGALHRGYGSASGQLNPGIFSSSLGNSGINAVAHSLDPEDIEPSSVKLLSASSVHSGMAGGIGPHNFENEAVLSSFSSVSAPELHITESSNVTKESGAYAQPLPSPSAAASDRIISTTAEPSLTTGDALDKYQIISEKLESLIANDAKETEIQSIIAEVPGVILKCISRDEAALAVAQKVFKGLYENAANAAHVGAHLAMLAAIRDVSKLVVKELTSWVIYSDEDRKFNKDITIGLIRRELLNLAEYNVHMAKLLDAGKNKVATEFAISLIQTLVASDARVISELHNLVDALAKLATRPDAPEALQQLVEIARNPAASSGFSAGKDDLIRQPKDKKVANHPVANRDDSTALESSEPDPAGFHEQVSMLFAEWYRIYELPGVNDAISARFVLQLQQNGLLKADDTSDRFFRRLLDVAVSHCISSEVINSNSLQSHQQAQSLSFLAIDMYASLVFSILKFSPVDHGLSKLSLLSKVLAVTVRFIQKDAEEKKTSFNPRPYFRLFIDWLLDLSTLDPVFEGANFQVLTALATSFHALQPLKVPAFSFVWLELVSHRSFMPKLLSGNAQKGWPYFQRLLVDLFQFMEPFLRNAELGEPVRFLYKGTLRVLLVLLHDFPEFLCDYHFSFCDIIPPSCIQMRNIVLSAFPRNMRLPDPSTPNLKIDLLAEISQSPRILSEVDAALKAKQMKSDVDEYLKTRPQGTSFLSELKQKLLLSPNEAARAGTRYNVPLMNSLVLYVGMQAIQQLQARTPHGQSMASNASLAIFLVGAALDIFQTLILELETEGRYLFLNAVANQLRYPNNHTHYFSFILLYLFSESNQEAIQEQITRVLLERLIVNRPHPWGLLITFIELIKNPRYNFWSRSFTRCAPEIEKLFESVSRSCGGPKPVDDNVVADTMH